MEVQEALLTFGKASDVSHSLHRDPHLLERRLMCNRRDYQGAGILEPDKSTIEKVIDGRRQKQAIFAIESFFIR